MTPKEAKFTIYKNCLGFKDFSYFDGMRFGYRGVPTVTFRLKTPIKIDQLLCVEFFDFDRLYFINRCNCVSSGSLIWLICWFFFIILLIHLPYVCTVYFLMDASASVKLDNKSLLTTKKQKKKIVKNTKTVRNSFFMKKPKEISKRLKFCKKDKIKVWKNSYFEPAERKNNAS